MIATHLIFLFLRTPVVVVPPTPSVPITSGLAEAQLYAALVAIPGITTVVGAGAAARLYPVVVPDGQTGISIAYQRVGTEYVNTIGNAAVAAKITFDIFCVAEEFGDAEALCDLVETIGYEKVNRSNTYDVDSEAFASVITVNVWPQ